ncbi:MAG TPA: hypothetical protein VJU82_00350 [Acidobacteriaceae bacterium]|nr:hypothetical protein [Acidobacteriaceae bacterium]
MDNSSKPWVAGLGSRSARFQGNNVTVMDSSLASTYANGEVADLFARPGE